MRPANDIEPEAQEVLHHIRESQQRWQETATRLARQRDAALERIALLEAVMEDRIEEAVNCLDSEIRRRNEWYGLDNWSVEEVVRFVVNALGIAAAEDSVSP